MKELLKTADIVRKTLRCKPCGAVIVAAGSAARMEGIDKVMADLGGEPLILRTARAFQACSLIHEIIVVTRPDLILPIAELCRELGLDKVRAVVDGGKTRQESVNLGLGCLSRKAKLAAIQDGARPLVTVELIERVVRAANTYGAAAPAIPVKDTIKIAKGGLVVRTQDRSSLYAVQTPQVFDFDLIRGALAKAERDGVDGTDDCAAVERIGMSVKLVDGEERNFKITTPMDLRLARALWREEEQS